MGILADVGDLSQWEVLLCCLQMLSLFTWHFSRLFKWVFLLGLLFSFLISYDVQADEPDSLCSSSVYPGTFPWNVRSVPLFAEAKFFWSFWLTCSSTPEQTLELVCQFPGSLSQASWWPKGRFHPHIFLDYLRSCFACSLFTSAWSSKNAGRRGASVSLRRMA